MNRQYAEAHRLRRTARTNLWRLHQYSLSLAGLDNKRSTAAVHMDTEINGHQSLQQMTRSMACASRIRTHHAANQGRSRRHHAPTLIESKRLRMLLHLLVGLGAVTSLARTMSPSGSLAISGFPQSVGRKTAEDSKSTHETRLYRHQTPSHPNPRLLQPLHSSSGCSQRQGPSERISMESYMQRHRSQVWWDWMQHRFQARIVILDVVYLCRNHDDIPCTTASERVSNLGPACVSSVTSIMVGYQTRATECDLRDFQTSAHQFARMRLDGVDR